MIIKSIPGIGDNLAARIIAELGDMTRFKKKNELVAFAGLDPRISESGQMMEIICTLLKRQ